MCAPTPGRSFVFNFMFYKVHTQLWLLFFVNYKMCEYFRSLWIHFLEMQKFLRFWKFILSVCSFLVHSFHILHYQSLPAFHRLSLIFACVQLERSTGVLLQFPLIVRPIMYFKLFLWCEIWLKVWYFALFFQTASYCSIILKRYFTLPLKTFWKNQLSLWSVSAVPTLLCYPVCLSLVRYCFILT
jgi:hypothetical protein